MINFKKYTFLAILNMMAFNLHASDTANPYDYIFNFIGYGIDDPKALDLLLTTHPEAIHAKDKQKRSLLAHALEYSTNPDIITVLMEHKIDPNQKQSIVNVVTRDSSEGTALHELAHQYNNAIITNNNHGLKQIEQKALILVHSEADPSIKDSKNRDVYDISPDLIFSIYQSLQLIREGQLAIAALNSEKKRNTKLATEINRFLHFSEIN